jgi:hypothetical protein
MISASFIVLLKVHILILIHSGSLLLRLSLLAHRDGGWSTWVTFLKPFLAWLLRCGASDVQQTGRHALQQS